MNLMWVCGAEIANLAAVFGLLSRSPVTLGSGLSRQAVGPVAFGRSALAASQTAPTPLTVTPAKWRPYFPARSRALDDITPCGIGGPLPGCTGRSAAAGEPCLCGSVVRPHSDRAAMAKLNDDQRRALEMLAHQDGCAEAALLADGFSIDQLAGLVVQGYAVMQRRRVDISGRMRTVVWMQITEAGRKAIAE
jgi:hypothetical protein